MLGLQIGKLHFTRFSIPKFCFYQQFEHPDLPDKNSLSMQKQDKAAYSKRKMIAAIIEDQQQEKELYEFLMEDEDFEELEIGGGLRREH